MGIVSSNIAERFAETSIRLFGNELSFNIDVPDDMGFEEVASAFERRGCQVEREAVRRRLTVTIDD